MRFAGWICALLWLSACLEPETLQFPPGATADARTVVWLVPDEAPIIQEVTAELRVPLHIQDGAHPRAMLYGCAPEELQIGPMLDRHGCLPPTERQLVSTADETFLRPATDPSRLPDCGPCELWPTILRHELQLPESQRSLEVGVVLNDGRVLMTVGSSTSQALVRVDLQQGSVEALEPTEGSAGSSFGPFWLDDSGLYALRDRAVWEIEVEGSRYRARPVTVPHPGASDGRLGALRRFGAAHYLATAFGGLIRTSSTSSTGWAVVRPNRSDLEETKTWAHASFAQVDDRGFFAVGVVWEDEHYQLQPDNPPKLLGYLRELDGRIAWSSLPSNQAVISALQDRDRAYVVSVLGEVYRLLPDGEVELSWSAEQRQDLRFAAAGPGRIWAAPVGGSFFPIYPDQGAACEPIPVGFGSLLLATETHVLHAAGLNLTIAEAPPNKNCGLSAQW